MNVNLKDWILSYDEQDGVLILGYAGENKANTLQFVCDTLDAELTYQLEIASTAGKNLIELAADNENLTLSVVLTAGILGDFGAKTLQIRAYNTLNELVYKSNTIEAQVLYAINATDEVIERYPTIYDQLQADVDEVKEALESGAGLGDMRKEHYDSNDDGVVNAADTATVADKVAHALTVTVDGTTTEYDGSEARSVSVTTYDDTALRAELDEEIERAQQVESTKADISSLARVATTGQYSDLLNKPTAISAFTNDVGYLTQHQSLSGYAKNSDLASVAFSGSYNDLTGKPSAYTLPVASTTTLGGVKAGNNVSIASNGKISVEVPQYIAGENVQINGLVISATDTKYIAGDNVQINGSVISATDTTYTAGENISIANNVISAEATNYTAGENITIENDVISATDTTYTAGENISITGNVISASQNEYTAGENVSIVNNVISATDTTYTAGTNVSIDGNVISATDTTYSAGDNISIVNGAISATYAAGDNVTITNGTISATDTTYTAGANVNIVDGVISATDTTYTAGDNISIVDGVISATDTTYTAGDNVSIVDGVISATDTTYTAGDNVSIVDGVISATDTTYTAGENVSITNGVISATDTTYSAGENITITNGVISATATPITVDASLSDSSTNPVQNNVITTALNTKQANLTAGENIQINENTITATDTTYTAGNYINISPENVISATGGNIGFYYDEATGKIYYKSTLIDEGASNLYYLETTGTTATRTLDLPQRATTDTFVPVRVMVRNASDNGWKTDNNAEIGVTTNIVLVLSEGNEERRARIYYMIY